LTKRPHHATHGRFNRIRQMTPTCALPNNASFNQPESTTQSASRSVQRVCRAHDRCRPTSRRRYSEYNNRPHLRT